MPLIGDASVATKWYAEEPGTAEAVIILRRSDLIAPEVIFAEVANAFWKRVRRGVSSPDQANAALAQLPQDVGRTMPIGELAAEALRLAIEHDHPIYDCLYVALARRENAPLVTADQRLAALAERAGVTVEMVG